MKKLFFLIFLTGCGQSLECYKGCPKKDDTTGEDTKTTIYAPMQGNPGQNGSDGTSCSVFGDAETVTVVCTDGTSAVINRPKDGIDGVNGSKGDTGEKGDAGINGQDGADGQKGDKGDTGSTGPQGPAGIDGTDGQDAILETINPCGPNPTGVDEIIFRLNDGSLMAWYDKVGLVILEDGNYKTTDSQKCYFTVSNGQITNEHE